VEHCPCPCGRIPMALHPEMGTRCTSDNNTSYSEGLTATKENSTSRIERLIDLLTMPLTSNHWLSSRESWVPTVVRCYVVECLDLPPFPDAFSNRLQPLGLNSRCGFIQSSNWAMESAFPPLVKMLESGKSCFALHQLDQRCVFQGHFLHVPPSRC